MTRKEAFKFAFLYRCAEEGLTVAQAYERAQRGLEKRAFLREALSTLGTGAKMLGGLGLAAGVGIPAVAGAGVGLGLANAQEHEVDPEEIRQQELIQALRFHAEQARQRAAMKKIGR